MKENLQILHQSYIQLCVIYFHVSSRIRKMKTSFVRVMGMQVIFFIFLMLFAIAAVQLEIFLTMPRRK